LVAARVSEMESAAIAIVRKIIGTGYEDAVR
jgi:hypothetical protein